MVERDPDLVGTVGVAEEDWELVADKFAAALAAARPADGWSRLAGCPVLLAAAGRGASHAAAFWQNAAKDRGTAQRAAITTQPRPR